MKINMLKLLVVLMAIFLSLHTQAAQLPSNISPQQIEQFKRLPPTQQRALAKSLGIDYNLLKSQLNGSSSINNSSNSENEQQVYPRGTQFDQFGNPVINEQLTEEEEDPDKIKPFGYDVFANAPQTFAPNFDIAVPGNYIIAPGDVLNLQMFGKENNEYQLSVTREGQVVIPQLGPFNVSGLTFVEMKSYLTNQIKNKVLGVDVLITVAELRSMRIFVAGDAYKPGPYVLNALSSITHALFAAGGINDIGSLRNIQLKRAGKVITTLDLYDLLILGDSTNDLLLRSGDVVFIPPVGPRVTVDGEVRRPAIYELKGKESFENAIKMAGGLLPSAYPKTTVVERFNQQNVRTVMTLNLSSQEGLNKTVSAGDYIRILKTSEQFDDAVTILGAVARPGKYQWQEEQTIRDLLPNIHAFVLEDADLNYSLIIREKDISRNIEILQFSLSKALLEPDSKDNITLQVHDKILIFSMNEKIEKSADTLEKFAFTQKEILDKEKSDYQQAYEDYMFWEMYNPDSDLNNFDTAVTEETGETENLAKKTMEELMGGVVQDELKPREIALFSRQRMLAPVIQKLQRQAATGQSIQLMEIVGAVKYPGIYPLTKNAHVNDALLAAGGLLESAYLEKAEITRNEIQLGQAKKLSIEINLYDSLNGKETENIALNSKDRLNVHTIPSWQENHIVELRGEFKFPGKYTIQRGENLSQLVERAGGYTDFAYTEGSVFTREKLKQLELQNLIKVSESLRMEIASKSLSSKESQMVDYSQAKLLLSDLTKVVPVGRLVVDLPKIKQDKSYDVLLENGDVLFVPTKQNSINVIGQVQVATSHIYQKNISTTDYIDLSGGIKQQADEDRIYIIKANGSVEMPNNNSWFSSSNSSQLSPGDTIVVPLNSDYMDSLTLWSTATQILYQAAVAVAAIGSI